VLENATPLSFRCQSQSNNLVTTQEFGDNISQSMAIRDDLATFPSDVPQPLPIPDGFADGERKIWPVIIRDLIDAGVKILPTYRSVLVDFCRQVDFLGQIRRGMAQSGGLDRKMIRAGLKQESELIKQICLLAGKLHLPHGDLGRYLTGDYWKRKGRREAPLRVPPASAWTSNERLFDRCEDRRYLVTLPLDYRTYEVGVSGIGEVRETGSGRTLNISSSGVLFEADRTLREGMDAALSIAWPATLSKSVGLTLRVKGRIVRADQNRAILKMEGYEFHTRSVPLVSEQHRAGE
jgi:hypothetical protein